MKVWKVTYTAKRKRTIYERQVVEVEFSQSDYERAFGKLPAEGLDTMTLETLAVEKGESLLDIGIWEKYDGDIEMLNESDFSIDERVDNERVYTVRLCRRVDDVLEAVVDVLALNEEDAGKAAIAKASSVDSNIGWEFRNSIPYDDEPLIGVVSVTEEKEYKECAVTDQPSAT